MDATPLQLFVYGSLRQGFNHAAYEYITRYFHPAGIGKAKGELYDLGTYPAAVPGGSDHEIVGELYRIIHPDEFEYAIAQLDDYEGVAAAYDQTSEYHRDITTVLMEDGTIEQAWIYWYSGNVTGKPLIPSGDVLEYMRIKSIQF